MEETPSALKWRKDVNRFEHTVIINTPDENGNKISWGLFLDGKAVTRDGLYIGNDSAVQGIMAVWYGANKFTGLLDGLSSQSERTCNVIAALDTAPQSDVVLDETLWEAVQNFQCGGREASALYSLKQRMRHILDETKQSFDLAAGVFHGEHKDRVETRLARQIAECESFVASLDEIATDLMTPQTPSALREKVLVDLISQVSVALDAAAKLQGAVADCSLPENMHERIAAAHANFENCMASLTSLRDESSAKCAAQVNAIALLLHSSCLDLARLKDESYTEAKRLGLRFFNRAGYVC